MLGRISIPIMYLCRSLRAGSVRGGVQLQSDGHSRRWFCFSLMIVVLLLLLLNVHFALLFALLLVVCYRCWARCSWLFHGHIISCIDHKFVIHPISNDSICELTHYTSVIPYYEYPTHPPVFIAPRILLLITKNGVFIPETGNICRIFHRFLPLVQSNINRFSNGFHSRIALRQALQHCRSKFVAKQTSLHQNNSSKLF